ncbi:MAG: helix-turn-helix transcriptional regulator [Clostridia bacterium]|nr:helix-turn-helix transcriptional regulator [Clostridia bacterium]
MFFEKEILSFNILDVLYLKQQNVNMQNGARNFNALSYRLRSDTVLKTKIGEHHLKDHSLAFFPTRLDYTRVSRTDEMIVVHFDMTNYTSRDIECFEAKNPEAFERLFRRILEVWAKKEVGYKYKCSAILYEIFAECYSQNYTRKAASSKIQASVDYILKNYRNHDLNMSAIAAESFMSEVYFRRLFKREYGISPQKYIINLRIQNAVGLISCGYYSLKEVALLSGYADYKYFSAEFKRAKGVSPSEYLYNYKE